MRSLAATTVDIFDDPRVARTRHNGSLSASDGPAFLPLLAKSRARSAWECVSERARVHRDPIEEIRHKDRSKRSLKEEITNQTCFESA